MKTELSQAAVSNIAQSWPTMQLRRRDLATAMARYFARLDSDDRDFALAITEMLFDYGRAVMGKTPLQRIEETARRHRKLGISTELYSRFGDGLGAAMKDVLGPAASPALLSAWGDAYWAIARSVSRQEGAVAAA